MLIADKHSTTPPLSVLVRLNDIAGICHADFRSLCAIIKELYAIMQT